MKVRKEAGQTCNVHCQVHLHPHKLFPETSAGTEQVSLFRPSFCLQFREQLLLFGKRQEEYKFQNMCYKTPSKAQQFQQWQTLITFFLPYPQILCKVAHSFKNKTQRKQTYIDNLLFVKIGTEM